jgi:hypothetical protein
MTRGGEKCRTVCGTGAKDGMEKILRRQIAKHLEIGTPREKIPAMPRVTEEEFEKPTEALKSENDETPPRQTRGIDP